MRDSTEQTGWAVTVLLAVAAIMACTLMPRLMNDSNQLMQRRFVVFLFMALLAICGVLAMRHKWKD